MRRTGQGRWLACCPAHEDKSPSLSLRDLPDGRSLVHCFGGCSVEEVLSSVGLTFDALFPEKLVGENLPRNNQPFPAGDVLEALADECDVLSMILGDIEWGRPLRMQDMDRAQLAISRIRAARSLVMGHPAPLPLRHPETGEVMHRGF